MKLEDRLEHLARAITNAKSAMGQGSLSQTESELLHQLEEKMEVLSNYNSFAHIHTLSL